MRIAFVVQRYGLEVCGGAELECRWIAERLARYVDVEVITTCALDHLPWDNYYPSGREEVNGVTVRRFPVDRIREHIAFDFLSAKVFGQHHSYLDELEWLRMKGPHSSELLIFLADTRDEYESVFFFTYEYFTTAFGMPIVADRAILIPNAHDDRSIYLDVYNSVFNLPRLIVYNSEVERSMVEWRFSNQHVPGLVVGTGINYAGTIGEEEFRRRFGIGGDYILYVGRVEVAKGCEELIDYFVQYKEARPGDLKLVLMGDVQIEIPARTDIQPLGFVDEEEKFAGIAAARLVVLPSHFESLSIVNLEAWMMGVPVLSNGLCHVLKDNCLKSNGGIYYTDATDFTVSLHLMLQDAKLRKYLAKNGQAYVKRNYSWDVVEAKYLTILGLDAKRLMADGNNKVGSSHPSLSAAY